MILTEVNQKWNKVLAGLTKIQEKTPDSSCWSIDQVYHLLYVGKCGLYFFNETDFMIVRIDINEKTNTKILFIWLMYAEKGKQIIKNKYDNIIKLATELGCQSIEFSSSRKGYLRLPACKIASYIYRIDIT